MHHAIVKESDLAQPLAQSRDIEAELLNSLGDEEVQMFDASKLNHNESLSLSKSFTLNELAAEHKSKTFS